MAYTAWAADLAAGRDSILLAPTNDIVAELNARARLDRLTRTPATPASILFRSSVSGHRHPLRRVGRLSRRLDRHPQKRPLATHHHPPHWVKNGHRWIIRTVHNDGSINVLPLRGTATLVRLPARYVATNTTLGYAGTIDAAQGMTAGHARRPATSSAPTGSPANSSTSPRPADAPKTTSTSPPPKPTRTAS